MGQITVGILALAISGVALAVVIQQRLAGETSFGNWRGGGHTTFLGAVAICIFIASCGVFAFTERLYYLISALVAVFVFARDQSVADRRYRSDIDALRTKNAKEHPGVFDQEPPTDVNSINGEVVDLYDSSTCTYIGVTAKRDIALLANAYSTSAVSGTNDIYLSPDSFELLPVPGLSTEFRTLLERLLVERDEIVLRWMPNQVK